MSIEGITELNKITTALDHPVRRAILKIVFADPGIKLIDLRRQVECEITLDHVKQLVDSGLLEVTGVRNDGPLIPRLRTTKTFNKVTPGINGLANKLQPGLALDQLN